MLHPGGARTALFNYLFARHFGGEALLRIEDTDHKRSEKRYEDAVLQDLAWLGLTFDGEVVRQSEREDVYRKYLVRLQEAGFTYEAADADGRVATFFRPPERSGTFRDELRGDVPYSRIEDFVVRKSDGTPSYNFAAVCDDVEMHISDVIRGEEHLSNTARQVMLYRVLGVEEPKFWHPGVILAPDGRKLSKRHGAESLAGLREDGFLPEAVTNYLALLGWNHPEGREYFASPEELAHEWTPERLGASPSTFDGERMISINAEHIRRMPTESLRRKLEPFLHSPLPEGRESVTVEAMREDMRVLTEAPELLDSILGHVDPRNFAAELPESSVIVFAETESRLEGISVLDLESAREFVGELRGWAKERGIRTRDLLHPLRLALTGRDRGPEMAYLFAVLGVEESRARIATARRTVSDGLY